MGAESSGLQRGAVVLEVMGGSVCPPAECPKWVLGSLPLAPWGTWVWGAPAPDRHPLLSGCWRPRQQDFTLKKRGVCFPRPCLLEVRTGGGGHKEELRVWTAEPPGGSLPPALFNFCV